MSHNFRTDLTQEFVQTHFTYDPKTGLVRWKISLAKRMPVGKIAGTPDACGYIQIRINKRLYKAARLIWLYMTGKWPDKFIDHINGKRADNRWSNLREVTGSQNQWNRGPQKTNKKRLKGIYYDRSNQKWSAQICVNYHCQYLGLFNTPEQAHEAYRKAAKRYHGKYARFD